MDRFVKSVNKMNSTVLVPSKLKDMDIVSNKILRQTGSIPPCLSNVDLYSFYVMLNDVKEELLWGPSSISPLNHVNGDECCTPVRDKSSTVGSNRSSASLGVTLLIGGGAFGKVSGKHSRQPSDGSLGSICSNTSSSSDFETDYEADSFARDKELDDTTVHLAQAFRQHLQALHTILHQFADAADYLSLRYQEEIDS